MASGPPSPSVGRRLRLLELLFGALLVLLVSGLGPVLGQKVYTNTWAVHIPGGQEEAHLIASKHGFINHGHVFGDYYHFRHRTVVKRSLSDHRGTQVRLQKDPKVTWAEQQVSKRRKKRDVYTEPFDPKFRDQWYLYNGNHRDLNAKAAWQLGYTGKGVVVSILDDGIEKNHPDLMQNYDPDASYDVNDGDPDPQPRYTQLNDNSCTSSQPSLTSALISCHPALRVFLVAGPIEKGAFCVCVCVSVSVFVCVCLCLSVSLTFYSGLVLMHVVADATCGRA